MADPALAHTTDDDLLARVASGEAAAFGELFRRRQRDVYRFALHLTGTPAMAEDIVQDVFLIVMRDAARYQSGRTRAVSWLCGIARNCALQRLDRDRVFVSEPTSDSGRAGAEPASCPDPVGDLAREAEIDRLRKAVLSLPLHYREAVVLCDLEEMSYAEAAETIGCAIGTVRSRLHRARELLAAKLTARAVPDRPLKIAGGRCFA
jgi:RNA polymerase sigma-70 factor (ECF subfamily)